MRGSDPLILPVGHYVGAYHPTRGAPLAYHTVRIGSRPFRLHTHAELMMWLLAHGPDREATTPRTRARVLEAARSRFPDAEEILDALVAEDVIVEVRPGTEDALGFAMNHRVMPLLFGLWSDRPDHSVRPLGLGTRSAVEVDGFGLDLWRFSGQAGDLWEFCETYARKADRAADSDPSATADDLLSRALHQTQALLARHAVYLDASPDGPGGQDS